MKKRILKYKAGQDYNPRTKQSYSPALFVCKQFYRSNRNIVCFSKKVKFFYFFVFSMLGGVFLLFYLDLYNKVGTFLNNKTRGLKVC